MKFTEKMQTAINAQIALEMWSANIYLSMSAYFAQQGLDGFAHWYHQQYKEELEHAEDMMHYIIQRGGKVKIQSIPAVETEFVSALEVAEKAYAHECLVSEKIEELVRLASAESDMPSQDFLQHCGSGAPSLRPCHYLPRQGAGIPLSTDSMSLHGLQRGCTMDLHGTASSLLGEEYRGASL